MNEEEQKRLDLEIKFKANMHLLPGDLQKTLTEFFDLAQYFRDQEKFVNEVSPLLHDLMMHQYPDFKAITHPVQIDWIEKHNKVNAETLYAQCAVLYKNQQSGVECAKKYPKLEEWRVFYCNPRQPEQLTDANRKDNYYYKSMSDEEWKKYAEEENRSFKLYFDWTEKRKNEFYNLMQPALFRHLPQLENLEGDWWVMFAVAVRDIYESWKTLNEELEIVIDYNLPPDSINWEYDEYRKALMNADPQLKEASEKKRDARIFGSDMI